MDSIVMICCDDGCPQCEALKGIVADLDKDKEQRVNDAER